MLNSKMLDSLPMNLLLLLLSGNEREREENREREIERRGDGRNIGGVVIKETCGSLVREGERGIEG